MHHILQDLTIIESASFIAAPSCGLYLSQFGASVIRIDPIGGGPDIRRWPRAPNGSSLYWESLNKGKKSITIDLRRPEGQALALDLITAPGADRGIFLTNSSAPYFSYAHLVQQRSDLIQLRVLGKSNGDPALDYTVNCAVGVPQMTGPAKLGDEPVNHVLPAWDLVTGSYAAFALLAAERYRRQRGVGQEIKIPLSDVAMSTLGNLGQIGEVAVYDADRPRYGNDLFGAFGRDFLTRDRKRIMLVALTAHQWRALIKALRLATSIELIEKELGLSFARDEGLRFEHRGKLNSLVEAVIAGRDYDELTSNLDLEGACWGPYRTLRQALKHDRDFSEENPVFSTIAHPSGYSYLTPGAAATFTGLPRELPVCAPQLGEHTDEILSGFLGLSSQQIGQLHDKKIVQGIAP